MGILADWQIPQAVTIEPFADGTPRPGLISYGVSSYGYVVRVGRHFKVFTNARCTIVDPKRFDPKSFVDIEGDFCLIPPNSFALAETVEYFEIPRDVVAVCVGKSTYARCGIIVNVTPSGAGVARPGDDRDQQHHPPAGQDLRRGRHRPDPLPPGRRRLPNQLRRQEREVPGPERVNPAFRPRIPPLGGCGLVWKITEDLFILLMHAPS
jgi:hypothetical protein